MEACINVLSGEWLTRKCGGVRSKLNEILECVDALSWFCLRLRLLRIATPNRSRSTTASRSFPFKYDISSDIQRTDCQFDGQIWRCVLTPAMAVLSTFEDKN